MQKDRADFLIAILRAKGIRPTSFRIEVLDIIERTDAALSNAQIEAQLESYDRITLYRTLKTFTEDGVIHEIALTGSDKRIALCASDCKSEGGRHVHQHAHFKCKLCEEVVCVELARFPSIMAEAYAVEDVEINLQGTCPKCQRK